MNFQNVEFLISAASPKDFPKNRLPEIAFAGKSNVGKSSVINRLLQRKNFARVGEKPGKTIHVNYFVIDKKAYLVDLPGYGFAKGFKQEQIGWQFLIEGYLQNSNRIKLICVLLDIRRVPSEDDMQMIKYLQHYNIPFIIIATKCDKFSKAQQGVAVQKLAQQLKVGTKDIFPVSALNKTGKELVLDKFDQFIGVENE